MDVNNKDFSNNGPATGRSGSRGSRINLSVMRNIFGWIGLEGSSVFLGKAVKAGIPRNLYLHFNAYSEQAMARCVADAETSVFDIFPVKSLAGPQKHKDPFSALMLRRPDDWDDPEKVWVRWDYYQNEVTLADALRPSSFVRVNRSKKGVYKLLKMHLVLDREQISEYRMGGGDLEEGALEESGEMGFGIQNGKLEGDEVSFFLSLSILAWVLTGH